MTFICIRRGNSLAPGGAQSDREGVKGMVSDTSLFLASSRSTWTSLLLHLSLQRDRHDYTASSARRIYFSKLLVSRLSILGSWLEAEVCFPFLPSWAIPNFCVDQFVLLWSVFLILRRMLNSESGQWKLTRWLNGQSLELQFGAPFGARILLVWADRPSLHLLPTSCSRVSSPGVAGGLWYSGDHVCAWGHPSPPKERSAPELLPAARSHRICI